MSSRSEVKDSFSLLLICSVLTAVLWFIPYAEFLVYPFRLFVTLIHEIGHAVAALVSFGGVNHIAIDWRGNGVTETTGGLALLISSAGYLSTTIYGAGMLLLIRRARHARVAALFTAAIALLFTIFLASNFAAWVVGLGFGLGLLALAIKGSPRLVQFSMSFLAVQSLLNAFYDLRVLIHLSLFQPGTATDAQNMAAATAGIVPALVWAVGWALMSLAVLGATLTVYYRSLRGSQLPATVLGAEAFPQIDRSL